MQEQKDEKAVAEEEDPKTGLEGTSSIMPYGSSRVALEGEHLDWGANGWVSEGLSVYEEYLLCVSRLDHLRTEQNQAPADVMTLLADVMTPPADQTADPSEQPLSAELVVAKQHVHQDIHNEGRRAPFKSSEVKNSRGMSLI